MRFAIVEDLATNIPRRRIAEASVEHASRNER
jgi:hypothetical protein